jgi:hypothetical protein
MRVFGEHIGMARPPVFSTQVRLYPEPTMPKVKPVEELTLHDFGWAPGGYTVKCVDCPKDIGFMENGTAAKRAWRCEKHAQQRLDEAKRESAPAAGAPKTTVDGE